jgi:hypothetical protein
MSKYLGQLKNLNAEKRLPEELTELTKVASVSSVSDKSRPVSENQPAQAAEAVCPKIVRVPPFGSDNVPDRYRSAWQLLLAQCPPNASPFVWQAAIFDATTLFGDFGRLIDEHRWAPGDLFDVPYDGTLGGLIWFIKGSPVVAIGRAMAQCQDGRIYRRAVP